MARIRSIKPSFFLDEVLAELGPYAQILFAALWTQADGRGRLRDSPKRIKAEGLPYYDVDVDALLTKLMEHAFILRYEHEGERYIAITNFEQHQRISGEEAQAGSRFPTPPGQNEKKAKKRHTQPKQSRSSHEAVTKQSRSNDEAVVALEGKGREGKGTDLLLPPEEDSAEVSAAPHSTPVSDTAIALIDDPVVLTYPCAGEPRLFQLRQSQVDRWSQLFPGVNVLSQCRKALGWCETNPRRIKTAKRMPSWLCNQWISNEQDKADASPHRQNYSKPPTQAQQGFDEYEYLRERSEQRRESGQKRLPEPKSPMIGRGKDPPNQPSLFGWSYAAEVN